MLTTGTRLGSYEITAPIGAGGMGEVYQAHETKLGRDVAIKVLPEAFAHDPERLSRFQREAKMLAALNHSNIATIYGLEQSSGTSYLVMELVTGETLADRVKREGAVPIEEALAIAKQIAEALEAAHEKGIIHRDLKPANVKLTPEGKVKVLDFGLAKAFAGDGASEDPSNSPTLSRAATMQGVILGTAAYMSPEQARGKAVDKRTDIWAFGAVLYELLTGKQVFPGDDISEILAAVIKTEPDWKQLPPSIPPKIRDLLRHCLQKDKTLRLRDAGDAQIEIQEAIAAPKDFGATQPARALMSKLPWAVAAGLAIIAVVALLGFWHATRSGEQAHPPVTRLLMGIQPAESILGGPGTNSQARPTRTAISWSPDGRTLVFGGDRAGAEQLYVRRLDQLQATPL
jgi:serine/threonine protein kinase